MNKYEELKRQVVTAVTKFESDQMSTNPVSISVAIHPQELVVTFRGATCPAERNYARDADARELLERFYNRLYEATKPILESTIQEILNRRVERSRLSVAPESGDGVILFALAGESRCEDGAPEDARAVTK